MPRLRPSPNEPKPPKLYFCDACAEQLMQISRMLPPGHCARCGRKGTRAEPVYTVTAEYGSPRRFAIHLHCQPPWFAKEDALHTMPVATIARLFLQQLRRKAQRASFGEARTSPPMPPTDAA